MINYSVYEEIVKVIYDYTKRAVYLDGPAIEKIIEIFIIENSLENYVQKLKYTYNYSKNAERFGTYCSYSYNEKKIYLNYNDILSNTIRRVTNNKNYETSFEKVLEINLGILNHVVHELFHSIQYKKVIEGHNDLEQLLLKISFESLFFKKIDDSDKSKEYIKTLKALYENHRYFYSTTPSEHMANVAVTDFECEVATDPKFKISKNLKESQKLKVLKAQLRDYDFNNSISPTMDYLDMKRNVMSFVNFTSPVFDIDEVKKAIQDNYESLCLDKRLYYGLEVSEIQQKALIKSINKIKKH